MSARSLWRRTLGGMQSESESGLCACMNTNTVKTNRIYAPYGRSDRITSRTEKPQNTHQRIVYNIYENEKKKKNDIEKHFPLNASK